MHKRACRAHGPLPRAVLGREQDSAHWPCFVFLFFDWIQNLANFKNLCKFGLKLEKYGINFYE
jgi:hypothetical protein